MCSIRKFLSQLILDIFSLHRIYDLERLSNFINTIDELLILTFDNFSGKREKEDISHKAFENIMNNNEPFVNLVLFT